MIRGGANGTGGTLKNVTNTGSVAVGTTETLGLAGTFINNGSVSIDGSAQQNNTLLNVRDDVTLAGSGLVTMSGGYNGAVIASDGFTGKTLTVGPGITIRGDGRFEVKLINQGTIEATNYMFFGLNAFLQRDSFSNGGILRAGSGSSIEVNGNTGGVGPVTFSNGGVIEARSSATIQFTGATSLTNYNAATQILDRRHLLRRWRHVESKHRPDHDERGDGHPFRRRSTVHSDQLDQAKQRDLGAGRWQDFNRCPRRQRQRNGPQHAGRKYFSKRGNDHPRPGQFAYR